MSRVPGKAQQEADAMSGEHHLNLVMALSDSDHVRDVVSGAIAVEGVDLNCLHFDVEEIFFRFTRNREWHISEMSMGKLATLRAAGDDSLIGIPVFTSRSFRHAALYIRPDGPVDNPGALRGGRIGIPEWTVTATVYGRDLLAKEYGVGLTDVEWVQAGTNEPGRIETLRTAVPEGVRVTPVADRSLSEMLLEGEIDAILAPHAPDAFEDGSGAMIRLFSDVIAVERDYHRRTGIFPIMHALVLRADVYREHPWIAGNLFAAFSAAKERSLQRAIDTNAPRVPIPWANLMAREAFAEFGGDPWPYGIEPNRTTLSAFLAMCHEQRLADRLLEPEDLVAVETHQTFRV
jgi:4,5-dihydroxyphthalate decarboxylase